MIVVPDLEHVYLNEDEQPKSLSFNFISNLTPLRGFDIEENAAIGQEAVSWCSCRAPGKMAGAKLKLTLDLRTSVLKSPFWKECVTTPYAERLVEMFSSSKMP